MVGRTTRWLANARDQGDSGDAERGVRKHNTHEITIELDGQPYYDLLTDENVNAGQALRLERYGVRIVVRD
ncbi:MAG: hypothetical protein U0528_17430 [Anaerolineae bacterium]